MPKAKKPSNKCLYCNKAMIVHEGQLSYYHKECRTEGRKQFNKGRKLTNKK